jgi:hypothetical protein
MSLQGSGYFAQTRSRRKGENSPRNEFVHQRNIFFPQWFPVTMIVAMFNDKKISSPFLITNLKHDLILMQTATLKNQTICQEAEREKDNWTAPDQKKRACRSAIGSALSSYTSLHHQWRAPAPRSKRDYQSRPDLPPWDIPSALVRRPTRVCLHVFHKRCRG